MGFCVECGREGETFEGVCETDFRKKHALVRVPEAIDVSRCAHCSRLKLGPSWVDRALEDAIGDLIAANARGDPLVTRVSYTWDLRPQDERNVAVTVKAVSAVGPWQLVSSFHTKVRVQVSVCPTCSRQHGKFFVGTVQIRAEGRALAVDEAIRARDLVAKSASGGEFVSAVEEVRGGFDVKVSSNAFAKRLARDLARELGGTVGSSATLHTQREGKDQYRATYVVRLAGFREGDTVLWRRGRYHVVRLGDSVTLEDATSGERVRVRPRELRGARVVRD